MASEEHTFSARVGLETLASKGVLHARAWVNGNSSCAVDFFDTHMQAGEQENGGDDVRSQQTKELVQFVTRRSFSAASTSGDVGVAAVIAGDFNINGRSSPTDATPNAAEILKSQCPGLISFTI